MSKATEVGICFHFFICVSELKDPRAGLGEPLNELQVQGGQVGLYKYLLHSILKIQMSR